VPVPVPPKLHVKDFERTTLLPRHVRLVPALAEAYFAYEGPMDERELIAFTREVDRAISTASKTLRFGLKLMLDVISLSPPFLLGKVSTFGSLTLDDRATLLHRLERSKIVPLALVFVAWKTLLTMIFFEDDRGMKALGYPGPERTRYLTLAKAP
jgi:hypothetical protein